MWRKRPPRGSGGSGELAACPQAQRHAGQEGQARRWAGSGREALAPLGKVSLAWLGVSTQLCGSPGALLAVAHAGPPASSPPRWWAGRQPRRGRGSPWSRLSRPAVGAGLAPRCQPLPGLKWPAWRRERGPVSERAAGGSGVPLEARGPDGAEAGPGTLSETPGPLCPQDWIPAPPPTFTESEGETTNGFAPPKCLLCTLAGLISFYG